MSWRDWQPLALFAAALAVLGFTTAQFIAPAVPEAARGFAWTPVTCGLLGLLIYGGRVAARAYAQLRVARGEQRDRQAARREAWDQLHHRLQQVHVAFAPESLRAEEERLRRALRQTPSRSGWARLLAIDGPDSDAWLGLARAWLAQGEVEPGLRCAAEAYRVGQASAHELGLLAQPCLGLVTDLSPALAEGQPAAATLAAVRADQLSPGELAALYRVLDEPLLPPTLRLVLTQLAYACTADREELARRREHWREEPGDDPDLLRWLRDGLHGYQGGAAAATTSNARPWLEAVPPRWRQALGLGGGHQPVVVRHREALPVYAVMNHTDLGPLADALIGVRAEPVEGRLGADLAPELLARQLECRFWPRSVRSRAVLTDALQSLAALNSPPHLAAGLVVLARALAEETDPWLLELRDEVLKLARGLPPDANAAVALHAAGLAHSSVHPAQAAELWEQAARLARKQEPGLRRELLGRFVSDWLALLDDPAAAAQHGPLLSNAAEAACEARDADVLLDALLAVTARPATRLREAVLQRLASGEHKLDARGRFLLAWAADDLDAACDAARQLWTKSPAPDQSWEWTACALAQRAQPGEQRGLGRLVNWLKGQAAKRDSAAIAGWLVCGYALDRIEDREARPEAQAALDALMRLDPTSQRLPLTALRATFENPDSRWLATVEKALLRRMHDLQSAARLSAGDLAAIESVVGVLAPARVEAHLAGWMRRYEAGLRLWRERLWAELAS